MVYDKIGLGRAIYTNGVDIDKTSTFTARAYEDSVDGYVEISVDGSGIISVPTTVSVSQGDTVMVTKVNNQSTVTGVVGGGDAMADDIDAAAAEGIAAAQAAANAQAEIDGVKEYFYSDSKGAHVTNTPTSPSAHMVTINSSGMSIIEDGDTVAKFEKDSIQLGKDSDKASIEIGDNAGYLMATGDNSKGFALAGTAGNPLQILSPNDDDDYSRGYGQISMLANGNIGITTFKKDTSGNYQGGAGVNLEYDNSTGTSDTTITIAADVVKFTRDATSSTIDSVAVIGRGIVRQMFIAEDNVSTLSANSFDDVSISISSHNCVQHPVCIPQSDGWLITQAPNSISTSSISGQVANFSGASHSGVARYLCIEYYGMDAPN